MPQGMEQFLSLFGNFTVANLVEFALAIVFCYMIYKKIRAYLTKKIKTEEERDKKIEEAIGQVKKYPEYRNQSIKIQQHFQEEIDILKANQKETNDALSELINTMQKRDRNRIRDRLLQSYRYYTNPETNPSQCITRMESEAFWELFSDYEEAGGDGFMHTVVQPAMNLLKIVDN